MRTTVGAIVLMASAMVAFTSAYDRTVAAVLDEAFSDDCVDCHEDCPLGQHVAAEDYVYALLAEWHRNGGVHLQGQCVSGGCEDKRGPQGCNSFALADAESVGLALVDRDIGEIARAATEHPSRVIVNAERGAVQLIGCRGAVMAHLPIDSILLDTLVEAMAD